MLHNLKIEWLKIRNYRTFWVLAILFFVCMIGVNYCVYQFKIDSNNSGPNPLSMLMGSPFSFPDVWQTVTYVSSFLLFLPGLILLILTTNEFNFKTHRQNIIDGQSRFEFAFSKILLAIIASLKATVCVAIIAIIIGLIAGKVGFTTDKIYYVFYFFLQAFTYSIVGVLFGFLFKRSGLAIALYFIYLIFIKNILSLIVSHYFNNVGEYFPVKSSDDLIPFPFFRSVTKQLLTPPDVTTLFITTAVYLVIFYFIIIKKFTRDDL